MTVLLASLILTRTAAVQLCSMGCYIADKGIIEGILGARHLYMSHLWLIIGEYVLLCWETKRNKFYWLCNVLTQGFTKEWSKSPTCSDSLSLSFFFFCLSPERASHTSECLTGVPASCWSAQCKPWAQSQRKSILSWQKTIITHICCCCFETPGSINADLWAADVCIKCRHEMITNHNCNHTPKDTTHYRSVSLLRAAVKRWPQ